jgi:hypothetical protein
MISFAKNERFDLRDVQAIKDHLAGLEKKREGGNQYKTCPECGEPFLAWMKIECEGEIISIYATGVAAIGVPGKVFCSRECAQVAHLNSEYYKNPLTHFEAKEQLPMTEKQKFYKALRDYLYEIAVTGGAGIVIILALVALALLVTGV